MILSSAWGLLALAGLPLIVAIHLFRRRYRPLPVSGLFLFGEPRLQASAGRTRQPLHLRPSFWLECLAVLAAAWYLTDPHLETRSHGAHAVLVLDTRRSMHARSAGLSVQQRAALAAEQLLARLDDDDRVTLVLSGAPPRLLAGPAVRPQEARRLLADWRCATPWHTLDAALGLALDLGGAGAQVTLISDREPVALPPTVGLRALGEPLPTAGIVDARWLRDAAGERIAVRLLAQGGTTPLERRVALRDAQGRTLLDRSCTLIPAQAQALTLPMGAGLAEGVRVVLALVGDDPLPDDDQVELLRPERRLVAVQVSLPEGQDTPLIKAVQASGDAQLVTPPAPAHLRCLPAPVAVQDGAWQLLLRRGSAPPVIGPFLRRGGDALVADLDCTGVLWSGGTTAAGTDEVLLMAGDATLLSARWQDRARLVTVWCDATRSTLTRHTAWPALIANLVAERRRALPGPVDPNLLAGAPCSFTLPDRALTLDATAPGGRVVTVRADGDGRVLLSGLDEAGIWRLDVDGGRAWSRVQVLPLDARQADLGDASTRRREAAAGTSAALERQRGPAAHLLPLVILGLAALGAWAAFRREAGGA